MPFRDAVVLLPVESLEDLPLDQEPAAAQSLLAAWTVPFHPAIVASVGRTVRWQSVRDFLDSEQTDPALVLVPALDGTSLPDDWVARAESAGMLVLRNLADRDAAVRQVLQRLDPAPGHVPFDQLNPDLVADLHALGFCQLQIELLTRQHYYMGSLDRERFDERALRVAEAILRGDEPAARQELQSAFDLLTDGREYFYAHEAHLLDLTLVAPTTSDEALLADLATDLPKTLLLSGRTAAMIAARSPETLSAMRTALAHQKADLAGGEFGEPALALATPEAILAGIRRGLAAYETHLGVRPTVFARRRFGLSPILPQILENCGFTAACHFTLDRGQFPTGNQSRICWEGSGRASLDALAEVPIDASRPENFLNLPERLAGRLDLDDVPTAVFAHWPGGASPWYDALRRMNHYGPSLGRFIGVNAYFEDGAAGHSARYEVDRYRSPYLIESVERNERDPISRWIRYYARQARIDAIAALNCMADITCDKCDHGSLGEPRGCLGQSEAVAQNTDEPSLRSAPSRAPEVSSIDDLRQAADDLIEDITAVSPADESRFDQQLQAALDAATDRLAKAITPHSVGQPTGRLALNPCSSARVYGSPQEECGDPPWDRLPTCPTVRVDVPAMGFAWIDPAKSTQEDVRPEPPKPRSLLRRKPRRPTEAPADEYAVRNEFFEAIIDPATGAVRAVHDPRTRGNRLAVQLALRDPSLAVEPHGSGQPEDDAAVYSIMAAERIEAEAKNRHQVTIHGRLVDRRGNRLAGFRQTVRARRGSRLLELDVELMPERLPGPDPWLSYYAVRFAWGDSTAELRRSVHLMSCPTEAPRFEAPHFVEIRSEQRRTTILTAGLPYHRQPGLRKLDCLLIVHGETARRFRLAVGIDLPHPTAAALDFLAPRPVCIESAPPTTSSGWLFHVDTPNVVATAWEPLATDGQVSGFRVRLLETEGTATSARLHSFRPPTSATQTDFLGNPLQELRIESDHVAIRLSPHQWTQLEVHCPQNP